MRVEGPEATGPPAGDVHPSDHHVLLPHPTDQVEGTLDEHPPGVGVLALPERHLPRCHADLLPGGQEIAGLSIRHAREDRQRTQLVEIHQIVARYRCTKWTAIAPSPTAEATRFIESSRTSPAAKTPGTPVSREYGGRGSRQASGASVLSS